VDEQKLSDLFQAAVRDVPPASFDERDVATASRRVTARRRSMLAGGSAAVVVLLAVGLVVGGVVFGHNSTSTSASVAAGQANQGQRTFGKNDVAPRAAPGAGHEQNAIPEQGTNFPATTPMQGGAAVGGVGPDAGSTPSGCGPTDGELAVALANELPSAGAPAAAPVTLACPAGARAAGYLVHDGTATGYVFAVLTPAGTPSPAPPAGATTATATAADGAILTVLSEPTSGSPAAPLATRLAAIAHSVAAAL
jgi:hypothetical protein